MKIISICIYSLIFLTAEVRANTINEVFTRLKSNDLSIPNDQLDVSSQDEQIVKEWVYEQFETDKIDVLLKEVETGFDRSDFGQAFMHKVLNAPYEKKLIVLIKCLETLRNDPNPLRFPTRLRQFGSNKVAQLRIVSRIGGLLGDIDVIKPNEFEVKEHHIERLRELGMAQLEKPDVDESRLELIQDYLEIIDVENFYSSKSVSQVSGTPISENRKSKLTPIWVTLCIFLLVGLLLVIYFKIFRKI